MPYPAPTHIPMPNRIPLARRAASRIPVTITAGTRYGNEARLSKLVRPSARPPTAASLRSGVSDPVMRVSSHGMARSHDQNLVRKLDLTTSSSGGTAAPGPGGSVTASRWAENSAVENAVVGVSLVDGSAAADSAVDDSAFDDSAVDDSAVDDSAVDDSAVDDSAVDDSAVDGSVVDEPIAGSSVVSAVAESSDEPGDELCAASATGCADLAAAGSRRRN